MSHELMLSVISKSIEEMGRTHHGDHSLASIGGAGQTSRPRLALVFINPTHRNISTKREWMGLRAPWIGCANIWQLLAEAGLIAPAVNDQIQAAGTNWTPEFTEAIYRQVAERGLYITNLVKWAGLDARLPERAKINLYTPLLIQELRLVQPQRIIAFGQLTFEALRRELGLGRASFSTLNEEILASGRVDGLASELGPITPCYFPVGQGIKNRSKAIRILQLAHASK